LPSQKQLKWSQLRVGITVILASLILAFLLFLMSGTNGLFSSRITLIAYVDNAGGLRIGAPVRLSGVDIGNVSKIRVVNYKDPQFKDRQQTPVEVIMRVNTKYIFNLRRDSVSSLETAGVLGETYIDIDSAQAVGAQVQDGDTLPTQVHPDFNEVVKSSQSTLQNMDALLKRADHILAFAESGKGSLGKLIYDPTLYDRFSVTIAEFQKIIEQISKGEGSLGALINRNDAYEKFTATLDKMNLLIDDMQQGKGTAGKLLKDPALYNNANDTIAGLKKVTEDINAGKGTIGKLAKDEELARKLDTTITKLSQLTTELEAGQGTAGKLFKDETLYDNANQMLEESRELVKAIRQDPKKYLSIKLHIF
jgi:phospholipid/cholesterol/gamma-HCH transport system substrate-binding protein